MTSDDAVTRTREDGAADGRVILRASSVAKHFGPAIALRDASLEVRAGEIHALVGENGSGKSTLVKILSGVHRPSRGAVEVDGVAFPEGFGSPRAAQGAGVVTVFQEVLSAPNRTVLDNLWLGTDGVFRGRTPRRVRRERAQAVLAELSAAPPPLDAVAGSLSLSDRQVCAVARALLRRPRVLILDEATAALDYDSRTRLFDAVVRLRDGGAGVVLITHRMDEVEQIGDRITVLRSGTTVGTVRAGEWTTRDLVAMMTGGEHLAPAAARAAGRRHDASAAVSLATRELVLAPGRAPISMDVRAGEIVGLAGLEGQGQDAFLRALAGFGAVSGDAVRPGGDAPVVLRSRDQAHRAGVAYVPRERRGEALFEWMSILDNFALPTIGRDSRGGLVRRVASERRFAPYVDALRIVRRRDGDAVASLSGGNQQKVVIARWLATDPRVLLLNDPTRGIDINAKRDLYRVLAQLAEDGMSVVMLSTEVDEHIELMDRVLVFREQECVRELSGAELTRQRLVAAFFGREAA